MHPEMSLFIDHSDNLYAGTSSFDCNCGDCSIDPVAEPKLEADDTSPLYLDSITSGQVSLLAQDTAGTLDGATFEGVDSSGLLFTLRPSSGSWQYSVLRRFDSGYGSPDVRTG
jgi:hypothetical protein